MIDTSKQQYQERSSGLELDLREKLDAGSGAENKLARDKLLGFIKRFTQEKNGEYKLADFEGLSNDELRVKAAEMFETNEITTDNLLDPELTDKTKEPIEDEPRGRLSRLWGWAKTHKLELAGMVAGSIALGPVGGILLGGGGVKALKYMINEGGAKKTWEGIKKLKAEENSDLRAAIVGNAIKAASNVFGLKAGTEVIAYGLDSALRLGGIKSEYLKQSSDMVARREKIEQQDEVDDAWQEVAELARKVSMLKKESGIRSQILENKADKEVYDKAMAEVKENPEYAAYTQAIKKYKEVLKEAKLPEEEKMRMRRELGMIMSKARKGIGRAEGSQQKNARNVIKNGIEAKYNWIDMTKDALNSACTALGMMGARALIYKGAITAKNIQKHRDNMESSAGAAIRDTKEGTLKTAMHYELKRLEHTLKKGEIKKDVAIPEEEKNKLINKYRELEKKSQQPHEILFVDIKDLKERASQIAIRAANIKTEMDGIVQTIQRGKHRELVALTNDERIEIEDKIKKLEHEIRLVEGYRYGDLKDKSKILLSMVKDDAIDTCKNLAGKGSVEGMDKKQKIMKMASAYGQVFSFLGIVMPPAIKELQEFGILADPTANLPEGVESETIRREMNDVLGSLQEGEVKEAFKGALGNFENLAVNRLKGMGRMMKMGKDVLMWGGPGELVGGEVPAGGRSTEVNEHFQKSYEKDVDEGRISTGEKWISEAKARGELTDKQTMEKSKTLLSRGMRTVARRDGAKTGDGTPLTPAQYCDKYGDGKKAFDLWTPDKYLDEDGKRTAEFWTQCTWDELVDESHERVDADLVEYLDKSPEFQRLPENMKEFVHREMLTKMLMRGAHAKHAKDAMYTLVVKDAKDTGRFIETVDEPTYTGDHVEDGKKAIKEGKKLMVDEHDEPIKLIKEKEGTHYVEHTKQKFITRHRALDILQEKLRNFFRPSEEEFTYKEPILPPPRLPIVEPTLVESVPQPIEPEPVEQIPEPKKGPDIRVEATGSVIVGAENFKTEISTQSVQQMFETMQGRELDAGALALAGERFREQISQLKFQGKILESESVKIFSSVPGGQQGMSFEQLALICQNEDRSLVEVLQAADIKCVDGSTVQIMLTPQGEQWVFESTGGQEYSGPEFRTVFAPSDAGDGTGWDADVTILGAPDPANPGGPRDELQIRIENTDLKSKDLFDPQVMQELYNNDGTIKPFNKSTLEDVVTKGLGDATADKITMELGNNSAIFTNVEYDADSEQLKCDLDIKLGPDIIIQSLDEPITADFTVGEQSFNIPKMQALLGDKFSLLLTGVHADKWDETWKVVGEEIDFKALGLGEGQDMEAQVHGFFAEVHEKGAGGWRIGADKIDIDPQDMPVSYEGKGFEFTYNKDGRVTLNMEGLAMKVTQGALPGDFIERIQDGHADAKTFEQKMELFRSAMGPGAKGKIEINPLMLAGTLKVDAGTPEHSLKVMLETICEKEAAVGDKWKYSFEDLGNINKNLKSGNNLAAFDGILKGMTGGRGIKTYTESLMHQFQFNQVGSRLHDYQDTFQKKGLDIKFFTGEESAGSASIYMEERGTSGEVTYVGGGEKTKWAAGLELESKTVDIKAPLAKLGGAFEAGIKADMTGGHISGMLQVEGGEEFTLNLEAQLGAYKLNQAGLELDNLNVVSSLGVDGGSAITIPLEGGRSVVLPSAALNIEISGGKEIVTGVKLDYKGEVLIVATKEIKDYFKPEGDIVPIARPAAELGVTIGGVSVGTGAEYTPGANLSITPRVSYRGAYTGAQFDRSSLVENPNVSPWAVTNVEAGYQGLKVGRGSTIDFGVKSNLSQKTAEIQATFKRGGSGKQEPISSADQIDIDNEAEAARKSMEKVAFEQVEDEPPIVVKREDNNSETAGSGQKVYKEEPGSDEEHEEDENWQDNIAEKFGQSYSSSETHEECLKILRGNQAGLDKVQALFAALEPRNTLRFGAGRFILSEDGGELYFEPIDGVLSGGPIVKVDSSNIDGICQRGFSEHIYSEENLEAPGEPFVDKEYPAPEQSDIDYINKNKKRLDDNFQWYVNKKSDLEDAKIVSELYAKYSDTDQIIGAWQRGELTDQEHKLLNINIKGMKDYDENFAPPASQIETKSDDFEYTNELGENKILTKNEMKYLVRYKDRLMGKIWNIVDNPSNFTSKEVAAAKDICDTYFPNGEDNGKFTEDAIDDIMAKEDELPLYDTINDAIRDENAPISTEHIDYLNKNKTSLINRLEHYVKFGPYKDSAGKILEKFKSDYGGDPDQFYSALKESLDSGETPFGRSTHKFREVIDSAMTDERKVWRPGIKTDVKIKP